MSKIKWTFGSRSQTDAVARCCNATFYRHSAATWLDPNPWRFQMPEHALTCYCGKALDYVEAVAR